ncbi:3-methyladenine DNA glycosylase 2 [Cellulomonas sp. WB94]|uniref:DNA-3-methyladenine glycosylase family protein n=1 Tax=Cellulomonas sp. WB94 TaxID=2173174 RepID=UPI000D5700A9|nr:DNA-3-methyladenine glycosylase 2 [Cellulomonas sp. WB94]PVU83158.1 3-methyladenine DNA glycosylase 2 [Cellulomonas sp. WB94]
MISSTGSGPWTRVTLELLHTPPFDATSWFRHVADRAVPGLERVTWAQAAPCVSGSTPSSSPSQAQPQLSPHRHSVTRLLSAPSGTAVAHVHLAPDGSAVTADLDLASWPDTSDQAWVVERLRRWLDLDTDPTEVSAALGADPLLGDLVSARPGLRIPGTVDPFEIAVRAVVGQQVSTAAATTVVGRIVAALGEPGPEGLHLFPTAYQLAAVPLEALRAFGLNRGRASTVGVVARAVADGLALDHGSDPSAVRAAMLALPGIGPWTADYVVLRALGHPDVFPAGDLVLRYAMAQLPGGSGQAVTIPDARDRADSWRPWRGYAAQHLWSAWAARPRPRIPTPRRSPTVEA